jgi:nitrate/nitrite-specific signal transduction histidine kinase
MIKYTKEQEMAIRNFANALNRLANEIQKAYEQLIKSVKEKK